MLTPLIIIQFLTFLYLSAIILPMSEFETIIQATENSIPDDVPAAADMTLVSLKVSGNGVLVTDNLALGF